eukprot:scaffold20256_cov18-Phaeocystis_antarctica.AAC.1
MPTWHAPAEGLAREQASPTMTAKNSSFWPSTLLGEASPGSTTRLKSPTQIHDSSSDWMCC